MCGIWAVFGCTCEKPIDVASKNFMKIAHRGPDASRIETDNRFKNCCVGFQRLTIVDSTYGMQPMRLHQYPLAMLLCNGELYNYKRLGKEYDFKYETFCDVECIFHLYENFGIEKCVQNLDGVFAFCIIDLEKRKVFLGRDPYGVRPLFTVYTKGGTLGVCSEAKGLMGIEENDPTRIIEPFPPGHFAEYDINEEGRATLVRQVCYHKPGDKPKFTPFIPYEGLTSEPLENVRNLLIMAVKKRLMADRRIGCLLSGGLDSSLIAAILVKCAKEMKLPYKVQSFSIGMSDSPDVVAAREVAKFIGTEHHEINFNEKDVSEVLDEVIYTLETPDITTVRASIPMYLLSKYIVENTDTTVIFSGEGADEVLQGYIYYRDAPNAKVALEDSIRLLREIYLFDGLRADRTISASSLELRVPFLDLQFTNYCLTLDPEMLRPKNGIEKNLVRSAFDGLGLLPDKILWRHKEAFSDGVASKKKSLFVTLKEIVDKRMKEVFDEELVKKKFPHCTPNSKEAWYYREVFEKSFPGRAERFIPYYWMPRFIEGITDPSARFIKHYAAPQE